MVMLRKILLGVATLFAILAVTAQAQTGPGGVGEDDQSLLFYLDAREASTSSLASGQALTTWHDVSIAPSTPTDAAAENPSSAPRYRDERSAKAQNGSPVVDFEGRRRLTLPFSASSANPLNDGTSARTVVVAFRTGADITTRQLLFDHGDAQNGINLYLEDGKLQAGYYAGGSFTSVSTPELQASTFYVATYEFEANSTLSLTLFFNSNTSNIGSGTSPERFETSVSLGAIPARSEAASIGAQNGASRFGNGASGTENNFRNGFDGQLALVAQYDEGLNDPQIRIVGNTIADAFGLGTEVRPGFSAAANFPGDIAAIGRRDNQIHSAASSSILTLEASSGGSFSNGEYIIIGHDRNRVSFIPDAISADDATSGGTVILQDRLQRVWSNDNDGPSNFSTTVVIDLDGAPDLANQDQLPAGQRYYILQSAPGESNRDDRFNANGTDNTIAFEDEDSDPSTVSITVPFNDDQFYTLARTGPTNAQAPSNLQYRNTDLRVREGNTVTTRAPSIRDGGEVPTFTLQGAPPNVGIDSETGALTFSDGGPTPAGSYSFTVEASTSAGSTSQPLSLTVSRSIVDFTYPAKIIRAEVGTAIDAGTPNLTYGPTNSRPPGGSVSFDVVDGSLPSGISLDPNGALSGTPTQTGVYPVTIEVAGSRTLAGAEAFGVTFLIGGGPVAGRSGPGGVGGPETNVLWLRADRGVVASDKKTGEFVWKDQSGNNHDFSQGDVDSKPSIVTGSGGINSRTSVQFDGGQDGSKDVLVDEDGETYINGLGAVDVFAVVRSNQTGTNRGFFDTVDPNGRDDFLAIRLDDQGFNDMRRDDILKVGVGTGGSGEDQQLESSSTVGGESVQQTEAILAQVRWESGSDLSFFLNGTKDTNPNLTSPANGALNGSSKALLGVGPKDDSNTDGWDGEVAEFIVYGASVGTAGRTIVQNYLAARYGIELTGDDVYAGDEGSEGDYDLGVFGIGRASGTDAEVDGEADGLRFETRTGLNDGDYMLAGHKTPRNSVSSSDVSGVVGLDARMKRTWYIDRTEPSTADLSVDVTIGLSEAGLAGPAGAPSDYVLLSRFPGANDWKSIASADRVIQGDEITFEDVSLPDETELTLGTTDEAASPLSTDALVVRGTVGRDGDDQGWRYVALPGKGGTAGDLLRMDGSRLIDFSLRWMAYTNPGDGVGPGGGSVGDGWTAVENPSISLEAGRGFILWLFDNEQYPIDPTITVRPSSDVTRIGSNDVVVGDENPSPEADPPLALRSNGTDNLVYLLGNPYRAGFDLAFLGQPGSDDFDDIVQIWEPDATRGGNDPAGRNDQNVGTFVHRSRGESRSSESVAPWQGFLLSRTTPGSGQTMVTFQAGGRGTGDGPPFVGSKSRSSFSTSQRANIELELRVRDDSGDVVAIDKAAAVAFHEDASRGRDYLDAPKLTPMADAYAALAPVGRNADGDLVLRSQESRPFPEEVVEVPLSTRWSQIEGRAEIGARDAEVPDGWVVTLVDTKTTRDPSDDDEHVLTENGAPYRFMRRPTKGSPTDTSGSRSASKSSHSKNLPPRPPSVDVLRPSTELAARMEERGGRKADSARTISRFRLRVDPSSPLPVELAQWDAQTNGNDVVLSWTTASETNNAGFVVQHQRVAGADTTLDPDKWTDVTFVAGGGTRTVPTSYRYTTSGLQVGTHAFRLRQVDTDGSTTPTRSVQVAVNLAEAYQVSAPHPNPARSAATLKVAVRDNQEVSVEVYDVLGRRVARVFDDRIEAQQVQRIRIPTDRWASGAYFVRVEGADFREMRRLTIVR
jgi:hypothetical protein